MTMLIASLSLSSLKICISFGTSKRQLIVVLAVTTHTWVHLFKYLYNVCVFAIEVGLLYTYSWICEILLLVNMYKFANKCQNPLCLFGFFSTQLSSLPSYTRYGVSVELNIKSLGNYNIALSHNLDY